MGKKRTHDETRDGFTKPSPAKSRIAKPHERKDKDTDKRRNGEGKPKAALVCEMVRETERMDADAQ